ncbi:hypothetical protein [Desnuesiella massiliensis]|nr:hypothetical protein [Desnuesiella massiliensis]
MKIESNVVKKKTWKQVIEETSGRDEEYIKAKVIKMELEKDSL